MKFGQLIEYNWEIFFFENHAGIEAGRLVPRLFLFFKKRLYEVKASGLHLNFHNPQLGHTIKTNCIKL